MRLTVTAAHARTPRALFFCRNAAAAFCIPRLPGCTPLMKLFGYFIWARQPCNPAAFFFPRHSSSSSSSDVRELALRIARKNAFLALFDGWGTLAADVAFISSTYAAHGGGGGTHTYTHIARTYNILREGRDRFWLAARPPPQGYCCSWPPPRRFRHLMSRPQYAIKTPRMRRPPDSKYPTNVLPILRNTNLEEIEMANISLHGCCICSPDQILLFPFRNALFQWRIRLRLASSSFPVPYILSNSYLEE